MKKSLFMLPYIALFLFIIANSSSAFAFAAQSSTSTKATSFTSVGYKQVGACNQVAAGFAHCLAIIMQPMGIHAQIAKYIPSGLTPGDLQNAYKLPSAKAGKGQTIAIVDAYDDPNAEKDLAVYRSTFGLPPCTTAEWLLQKSGSEWRKSLSSS